MQLFLRFLTSPRIFAQAADYFHAEISSAAAPCAESGTFYLSLAHPSSSMLIIIVIFDILFLDYYSRACKRPRVSEKLQPQFSFARRLRSKTEDSVKNKPDGLFFTRPICAGASQMALMASEKLHSQFLFAPSLTLRNGDSHVPTRLLYPRKHKSPGQTPGILLLSS